MSLRRPSSIRSILLVTVSTLTLLIVVLALNEVWLQWRQLTRVQTLREATYTSDRFFNTLEHFSREREITLAMLKAPDAELMKHLHSELERSRHEVDEGWLHIIPALSADSAETARALGAALQASRQQVDHALTLPLQERDKDLPSRWFGLSTDNIGKTYALWMDYTQHFTRIDPVVTQRLMFQHFLGLIIRYSGRERAIIGGMIVANEPIMPEQQAQLLQWRGIIEQGWEMCAQLSKRSQLAPDITPYLQDAESHYRTVYEMVQDLFYDPGAPPATSYPISIEQWLEVAGNSTDSLVELKDAAMKQTRDYAEKLERQARRSIAIHIGLLLFALILCAFSLRVVNRRVIAPIQQMIVALLDTVAGKVVTRMPEAAQQGDEIGKLADVLHALQTSIQRYRTLTEASSQIIWVWREGNIDGMSPLGTWWEATTGQPASSITTFGWLDIVHPDDRDRAKDVWANALAEGTSFELEYRLRARGGNYLHVAIRGVPLHAADGTLIEYIGSLNDITERKQAESKNSLLAAVIEASDDAIISKTLDGIITSWNRGAEHLFGYTADEMIGKPISTIIPPEKLEEEQHIIAQIREGIKRQHKETERLHKSGRHIPISVMISPIFDMQGKIVGASTIARDITDRKEAEQEIQDAANRLRAVFDTVLDGLITIDSKATILSFNAAAERIFGYKEEEVVGQNVKMLMPEPYHHEHDTYVANYLRTGDAKVIGIGREVTAKRKNGSTFPMELGINQFKIGADRAFVGMIRDITDRKMAEMALQRYTSDLERSNKELDDFAYIASHDLKEPLRGIHNHSRFLLEDNQDKLEKASVDRLHRLLYLTQRMEKLVNDLLYFSRLGRQELAIQPTDMNLVVADITTMIDVFLAEHHGRVLIPTPLPTITCDRTRITEVLRNLITNAIKYNDNTEKTVEIGFLPDYTVKQSGEIRRNVFYVKDNGVGIALEFHEEVFRIFKRLQNSNAKQEDGTGVGLTFVKKIIERHGGKVWLESEPGKGTIFYFTLGGTAYVA